MKFVLNGCDIQLIAEAPEDITLKQLIKQCDKIKPYWCTCGICSIEEGGFLEGTPVDVFIDYDSVRAEEDANCTIAENKQLQILRERIRIRASKAAQHVGINIGIK